eukprot:scaffold67172_cov33-Tisochrysis_lutea.AAC.1
MKTEPRPRSSRDPRFIRHPSALKSRPLEASSVSDTAQGKLRSRSRSYAIAIAAWRFGAKLYCRSAGRCSFSSLPGA